eukprot:2105328-Rhodomonas_salina.1
MLEAEANAKAKAEKEEAMAKENEQNATRAALVAQAVGHSLESDSAYAMQVQSMLNAPAPPTE